MRLLLLVLSIHLVLLLVLSPICLISAQTLDPYADDLYLSQCTSFDVPFNGRQNACISARVNRCNPNEVGVTVNVMFNSRNYTYILNTNSSTFDGPPPCIGLPSICGSGSRVCVSLDDEEFKITPSYLLLKPIVTGTCQSVRIQPPPRAISVGADCDSARSCDTCTSMRDAQSGTPCGWCTTLQKCYASDPTNRPYCYAECTQNGLLRNGQCAMASSTEWSAGKTAMVVVLAVVIPVIAILLVLLVLRHFRLKKQGASSPGVIQARTQGYRQNVDHSVSNTNVDSETSLNAPNSNAEFRQMPETEGYQPPSSRPSTASAV